MYRRAVTRYLRKECFGPPNEQRGGSPTLPKTYVPPSGQIGGALLHLSGKNGRRSSHLGMAPGPFLFSTAQFSLEISRVLRLAIHGGCDALVFLSHPDQARAPKSGR